MFKAADYPHYPTPTENIHIPLGATYKHKFAYTHSDGAPVDLRSCAASLVVKDSAGTVIYTATDASGHFVIPTAADYGAVDLELQAADIAAFTWTSGTYVVSVTLPDGEVVLLRRGDIYVGDY